MITPPAQQSNELEHSVSMHAVHTPQTSSHSEGCKQTQACSPACQPLFLRWSAAQHAVLCTHPPAALHVLLCCRLQLPASCLPHAPDVLYVVLYSGQLLQDAAPLLVVPLAVAQELQALFEDMQQQPAADGTEPTEEQAAGHAQVTCCSWWRAGTCRGRSSCADAHSNYNLPEWTRVGNSSNLHAPAVEYACRCASLHRRTALVHPLRLLCTRAGCVAAALPQPDC